MGQEFHVLRCYSCQTFQVQQVKKAKKWSCKMCGEKQSVFKEFGRGTGAGCRRHVQELNAKRGELEQAHVTWSLGEKDEEAGQSFGDGARRPSDAELAEESRWDKYLLNTPQEGEEPEDTVYLSTSPLHDNGNARKRKRAVGRADEGSSNEEMQRHRREAKLPALPISKSSTVQHTRISISSCSNQTRHGFTRGTINTDYNQANPGFTRGTFNTDHNQANPGLTRRTINTDHNQANPGLTRGTVNTETNQTKPDVSNYGSDRVRLNNKPCSLGSSAAAPSSKWTQFLPVPHPQEKEEEEQESHLANNMERKPLDMLESSATPCSSVGNIRELGHPAELPKAVSSQTLTPHHQPCPSLPFNSLFNTCDDFDDMF
ncbi:unnamed protein product [Lota lota]